MESLSYSLNQYSAKTLLNPNITKLSLFHTHFKPNLLPNTTTNTKLFKTVSVFKRNPKRLKYHLPPSFSKENGLLYVEVDPSGADSWKMDPVVELLKAGAVGVIPTDTVYAIVCDMKNNSAVDRLRRIKGIETSKPLSVLCRSFRDIDTLTTGFPRGNGQGDANLFRAVKHCLPGPYTFILTASKELPKQCTRYGLSTNSKFANRKSVGVRIPDDDICQVILEKMEAPLISTSVRSPKKNEWILDPVMIADLYGPEGLDFVVAAGVRVADPSTVVDMTGSFPKIIRQGKASLWHEHPKLAISETKSGFQGEMPIVSKHENTQLLGPKQPWMVADDEEEELTSVAA